MTTTLLKYLEVFLVFWPISIMLQFKLSPLILLFPNISVLAYDPVGWIYWIHRLLLWREDGTPNGLPRYDTKQSDGEARMVSRPWGMRSTPSLPSFQGSLCPGVVAPERVQSIYQIEPNCVLLLNWIFWNRTVTIFKLRAYAKLNCLKQSCFYILLCLKNCTYDKRNCLK